MAKLGLDGAPVSYPGGLIHRNPAPSETVIVVPGVEILLTPSPVNVGVSQDNVIDVPSAKL